MHSCYGLVSIVCLLKSIGEKYFARSYLDMHLGFPHSFVNFFVKSNVASAT